MEGAQENHMRAWPKKNNLKPMGAWTIFLNKNEKALWKTQKIYK
jgi:hypothetical protein